MFDTYIDIFTERAREYHLAMSTSPKARDAEFRAVVEPIANASSGLVCDMPSGGCYLAGYLPGDKRYVGVEPVDDFLKLGPPGHEVIKAPFDNVPLPDGSVDYVVSLAGLHHETSLTPIFAEVRRLLRCGGSAVIADVQAGTPPAGFLNGFVAHNNPLGHDGRFLDRETARLLDSAGLRVREDEMIDVPWVFGSLGEAASFCGHLFGITAAGQEAILEALNTEIGLTEKDGQVLLSWTLRRIVCGTV